MILIDTLTDQELEQLTAAADGLTASAIASTLATLGLPAALRDVPRDGLHLACAALQVAFRPDPRPAVASHLAPLDHTRTAAAAMALEEARNAGHRAYERALADYQAALNGGAAGS